jgi:membrane-anchored glycerophosphoryl diester phosphodiesterase (GDPDase)
MLLNWLEQRLKYTQRKRLRKLISNLTEIVYVNALFALIMLIMLLPFIILFLSGDHPAAPVGNCYAPPDGCQ